MYQVRPDINRCGLIILTMIQDNFSVKNEKMEKNQYLVMEAKWQSF